MRKLLIGLVVVVLALVGVVAAFLFVPSPLQGWAAERIAPMRAYLFADAHPAMRVPSAPTPVAARTATTIS